MLYQLSQGSGVAENLSTVDGQFPKVIYFETPELAIYILGQMMYYQNHE